VVAERCFANCYENHDIRATTVTIPLKAPLRHPMDVIGVALSASLR
jgi:hypothetical protein